MHAAVVTEFNRPPRYQAIDQPSPTADEELVDVVAAALHPRVRSQANGSHYTSTDELPLIPGIDGVGRRADGSLVYFVLPDTSFGSMAERTVIDPRRSVPLSESVDAVRLAAAMNPAMSSWVALQHRVEFVPGQSVLILGATGSAGQLAIQIAKHFGAGEVFAAGRGQEKLDSIAALGADHILDLESAHSIEAAGNVDVVLDYLWGAPAESAIMPLLTARDDRASLLSWVQIGAVAGPTMSLPSAALRQANIHFLGSGQGSVSTRGILDTLPALVERIEAGAFTIDTTTRPLSEVEQVWTARTGSTERVVLIP